MSNVIAVRFKKSRPPYSSGEVAGFDPKKAAQLVGAGVADYEVNRAVDTSKKDGGSLTEGSVSEGSQRSSRRKKKKRVKDE